MKIAHDAVIARQHDDMARANHLYAEAFALEREAALALRDTTEVEPTRSVLLRSAASLALACGETREAERLAATALSVTLRMRLLMNCVSCWRRFPRSETRMPTPG